MSRLTGMIRGERFAAALAWLLAAGYVVVGLAAMWLLSPRVPYADAWRQLARFLSAPFPGNVLAPENGHSALLPNLLRVLDIQLVAGDQRVLTVAGMVFAVATLAVAWRIVRGLPSPTQRAAAMLSVALGLFWLGNGRVLMHGAESVHAYAVTLFLFIGLWLLGRDHASRGAHVFAILAAVLCGAAATFSFGSGIACFAAFGMVALLRRSPWGLAGLIAGALLTYALVQLAGGTGVPPAFDPLRQVDLLMRWLGGPLAYAAWPALEPRVALQLPGMAAGVVAPVAFMAQAMFGEMANAPRWPHAAFGLVGAVWMTWLAWHCWRLRGAVPAAALTGLGLAAFAVATGALLAAMRLGYFDVHPGQLLASRYLVWSSLFWAGLLLATVALLRNGPTAARLAIAGAVLLLPSEVWMTRLNAALKPTAERVAMAVAVGVVEPELWMGENVVSEIAAAAPLSRAAGVTVHAWPETRMLGQRVSGGQAAGQAASPVPGVIDVDNLIGPPGRRVTFQHGTADCAHMLLVDADGVARGLARQDRHAGEDTWVGWMQGRAEGLPRVLDCAATQAALGAVRQP